jgi:hypothetical protein
MSLTQEVILIVTDPFARWHVLQKTLCCTEAIEGTNICASVKTAASCWGKLVCFPYYLANNSLFYFLSFKTWCKAERGKAGNTC